MSYSVAISVFSLGVGRKGRGCCVRSIGHEHDCCRAQKAENTDPCTNYAVKYATARGHLTYQSLWCWTIWKALDLSFIVSRHFVKDAWLRSRGKICPPPPIPPPSIYPWGSKAHEWVSQDFHSCDIRFPTWYREDCLSGEWASKGPFSVYYFSRKHYPMNSLRILGERGAIACYPAIT